MSQLLYHCHFYAKVTYLFIKSKFIMNEYYDNNVINGVNPSFIWCQLAEYFTRMAKTMRHEYSRNNRTNKTITWTDLDVLNKRIRKDLDMIYAGTTNVSDNVPSTNENKQH